MENSSPVTTTEIKVDEKPTNKSEKLMGSFLVNIAILVVYYLLEMKVYPWIYATRYVATVNGIFLLAGIIAFLPKGKKPIIRMILWPGMATATCALLAVLTHFHLPW